ncbi:MAG: 1-(5-phosphoribosyl)-5-[(5-phosphoribosylamino)methylideneamino]imidazole-4-carboxamide isomerase [Cytophagaceae bacterium]|nr:1-(5-phosphoribosyl)-5-[(5-phosphoribosylamino)methylideneamino]imidazole-4-carboxamide isomerase [Cytophagaceae bacterium]MDW8455656.1 1-(5-phosphoribosyl)-5-[(5-phosphoribosylamino)methylideneamino]imidazole-4-carboxamide isomerase [Cytophagaceae bacterium]
MFIIPAIDIIDGKCVRLTQGDYAQKKIYNEQPLEVAKKLEDFGIKRLHLVDLDGAKQKKIVNINVLQSIAAHTSLHIDFGGGIQSDYDIELAFNSGARQVTAGSIAIKNPTLVESWINQYGHEKIILGADTRMGTIAISGWQENTETSVFELLQQYISKGLHYCICTDVTKDGLLQGPSFDLYSQILQRFPKLKLIASGGVSSIEDVEKLNDMGLYGVIIGKAFYEGKIKLQELSKFLH